MNQNELDEISAAILRIRRVIPDTHVDSFYRGDVEPSIVVVIPGVRLVDGRLIAVDGKGDKP